MRLCKTVYAMCAASSVIFLLDKVTVFCLGRRVTVVRSLYHVEAVELLSSVMSTEFLTCLLILAFPQLSHGQAFATFSKNPVYENENVTLSCTFGPDYGLTSTRVDAFNGSRNEGTLSCLIPTRNTTGTGVFAQSQFVGCPRYAPLSGWVNVTFQASRMSELDYNCTVQARLDLKFYYFTSNFTRLRVHAYPSPPSLNRSSLVFNDSDDSETTFHCESRYGDPPSLLSLTVTKDRGTFRENKGNESVSLTLPPPLLSWHGATVVCTLENHISLPNRTVQSVLHVNHITLHREEPIDITTYIEKTLLNCSEFITSFPGVLYRWTVPSDVDTQASLTDSIFVVPRSMSGVFTCTAANVVSGKSVTVTYNLTSRFAPVVVSVVLAVVAGITVVVLVVLYKKGIICRSKRPGPQSERELNDPGSNQEKLLGVSDSNR